MLFLPFDNVKQPEVYIYPLSLEPPSHPLPSHPSRLSQSTRLLSQCYTTTSHHLSILHMVIYIFQCCSLHSSHSLHPLLCPQVHSLHLWFYSSMSYQSNIYHFHLCFFLIALMNALETFKTTHWKKSGVTQSCPILCDLMDCSLPGSSLYVIRNNLLKAQ